jgi:crotonobetainyl-CoA:carnitine CoA-transferase CaiB-like acyl-CoA transferase
MPIFDTRRLAPSPPCPFPSNPSFTKPLEGIKVVALTRIIAGQVIGRQLAELGATVIKVNPPHRGSELSFRTKATCLVYADLLSSYPPTSQSETSPYSSSP